MEDIILDENSKPMFDNPGEDLKSKIAKPRNHPEKPVKRVNSIVNEVFKDRKPKLRRRGVNINNMN
jgi:hypothetical protein